MIYQEGEKKMICNENWNANDFVQAIFELEELDQEYNLKLFRQIKNKFTDRFGNELYGVILRILPKDLHN
ncbi:MAG: hypothetical protein ABJR05_10275 [Balneola sp.]